MTTDNEPRALGAALSAPAFVTRGYSVAMHTANRHVERWAPEAEAGRVRSMRSLGFVDRLVAPWMETAQRSASMRLFSQYARAGMDERQPSAVSWVFPRPWYQDELDWMAAARQATAQTAQRPGAPTLLTTRGTYVPAAPSSSSASSSFAAPSSSIASSAVARSIGSPPVAMPSALYEYVAPSLSLASSQRAPIAGVGFGGETMSRGDAYSPLISLAAVQAADLMSRAVAPLAVPHRGTATPTAMTPGLRSVLTSILERAAAPRATGAQFVAPGSLAGSLLASRLSSTQASPPVTRLATSAPELVTPPAPRESELPGAAGDETVASASATRVAEQYAEQRMRVVELQRIAQQSAQRELAARAEAVARTQAGDPTSSTASAARGTSVAASDAAMTARAAGAATTTQLAATSQAAATAQAVATAQAAATADVRAQAARAEAELRQRASATRAAEVQRHVDAAQEAAAERARLEERVAQRLAERTGAPRLHEQARAEAAAHARTPIEPARGSLAAGGAAATSTVEHRAPAEVTAAIAGLPPELAAILGSAVTRRPERALQAISELNETLRTVELLARSSATGAAFEATRGPRLMMPAGLGGLVSAVDRAQMIADRPAMLGGARALAPQLSLGGQPAQPAQAFGLLGSRRPVLEARVPALPWLSDAPRPQEIATSSALGATAMSSPAALSHVAWADRWLARFAGAGSQSLDMISAAAAASPATRMAALASAAPGSVFVAPDFLRGDLGAEQAVGFDTGGRPHVPFAGPSSVPPGAPASAPAAFAPGPTPGAGVLGMRLINPAGPAGSAASESLRRFDDTAETPDDVFAAISAAASRGRVAPSRPAAGTAGSTLGAMASGVAAAPAAPPAHATVRTTLADVVAHSAPVAPGAGLSAQLASSPFAPALRHMLPVPSAASFDIRSLFGAGLGATYLAGLIGPASRELEIGAQRVPAWAAWSEAPSSLALGDLDRPDRIDRVVPAFDAAYVSPEASGVLEDRDSLVRDELAASGERAASVPASRAFGERGASLPLTTLRTALLSWELTTASEPGGQPAAQRLAPASFASVSPFASAYRDDDAAPSSSTARSMIEAMRMPMLGEVAADQPAQVSGWAAPGMIAERAHTWAVAQERSSSDLAFDFVTPELVLAARVYGLGPAEAAQAARLAIAGPNQLGAMASTVDRAFVEAMAIGREARDIDADRRQRVAASGPVEGRPGPSSRDLATGVAGTAGAPSVSGAPSPGGSPGAGGVSDLPSDARAAITTAFPTSSGAIAAAMAPTTRAPRASAASSAAFGASFGVDRRAPRGAFLWPSATVAALGMTAAGSDGQLSIPVAALELLAAQVVAELGTFTALSEAEAATRGVAGEAEGSSGVLGARLADAGLERGASPGRGDARVGAWPSTLAERRDASDAAAGAEPGEADVLGAAAALVPASRRARFDALYVALSQSSAGKSWSPAARAARALALAGRGENTAITARERAATAWDVLPVVYPSEDRAPAATPATAGYASAAAAISTYAAPSGLGSPGAAGGRAGSPAGTPAPAGRAGGPRTRRDGSGRELVSPDAPGSAYGSGAGADPVWVQVSPGLAGLSARAGEALGSYVMPPPPPVAPPERPAPEYVRPSRSGGRYGGGEPEIPPWFEAAARKMLADRSGDAGGISLAELTLVTAAPASHIAASTRSAPSSAPPGPSSAKAQQSNTPQIDVEKLANEVYRSILVLMDVARARNGDSYL